MKITVAVIICHALAPIKAPVCREEVVVQKDMSMQACMMAQPAIAEWKNRSIFRGAVTFWLALFVGMAAVAVLEWE